MEVPDPYLGPFRPCMEAKATQKHFLVPCNYVCKASRGPFPRANPVSLPSKLTRAQQKPVASCSSCCAPHPRNHLEDMGEGPQGCLRKGQPCFRLLRSPLKLAWLWEN